MGKGGKASEPATPTAAASARAEAFSYDQEIPNFTTFLQDGFSPAQFANRALQESSFSGQAQIAELERGIRLVKEKLSLEVVKRQDDFIEKAAALRSAEQAVQRITSSAEGLAMSLKRVSDDILEPHRNIQTKTVQLRNLQASTDVLRQILQSIKVTQRLKTLMGSGDNSAQPLSVLDLGKAAKLLTEAKSVNEGPRLSNIKAVQAEAPYIHDAEERVVRQAQVHLDQGMETTSQAEVGAALQIFFNLNQLTQAVPRFIDGHVSFVEKQLNTVLDPRKLVGEAASSGSRVAVASARLQEVFWQRMADFFQSLHKSALAVWHFQRVLVKKRDPLTHVLFADVFRGESGSLPLQIFWPAVCERLKASLDISVQPGKGVMRETLIHNFPHFAALADSFSKNLHQETNVRGVEPAVNKTTEDLLSAALSVCQNLYLGAVFSRVSDAITSAFPGGNRALPTSAELQKCIGRIHEELKNIGDSPHLAAMTTSVIGKALRMLAEKAEFMALAGTEVRNVTGVCTTQQMRKITLSNHLQEVSRSVAAFLPRLPPSAAHNLREPIEVLEAGVLQAVLPLVRAIVDHAESILLKLHEVNFASESAAGTSRGSAYVQEFSRHLTHCRVEFLSKLSPPASPQNSSTVGGAIVQRMASRLIVYFIRHAAMLRPLTQTGSQQLTKDVEGVEESISANLWPAEKLSRPHRMLHAFRKLVSLQADEVTGSPVLKDLPISIVAVHLCSRLPSAIPSPHVKADLTPQQFSLWLDEHNDSEARSFIRSSLESFQASTEISEEGTVGILSLIVRLCTE